MADLANLTNGKISLFSKNSLEKIFHEGNMQLMIYNKEISKQILSDIKDMHCFSRTMYPVGIDIKGQIHHCD